MQDLVTELSLMGGGGLVILGDFNTPGVDGMIDGRLQQLIDDAGMIQRVERPTHCAVNSLLHDSLLDVVIHATDLTLVGDVDVVDPGISDHLLVMFPIVSSIPPPSPVISYEYRDIKGLDRSRFIDRIYQSSFVLRPAGTTDSFYEQMRCDVGAILDDLAPIKKLTRRQRAHGRGKLSPFALAAK
jgi:hypothetical protein